MEEGAEGGTRRVTRRVATLGMFVIVAVAMGGCSDSSVSTPGSSTPGSTTQAPDATQSADPTAPTGVEPPVECTVVYSTGPGGTKKPARVVLLSGQRKQVKFADLAAEFKRTADGDPASNNTVFVSVTTAGGGEKKPLYYATYPLPDLTQSKLLNQITATPQGKEQAVFSGEASVLHPVSGTWVTYACRSLESGADQNR